MLRSWAGMACAAAFVAACLVQADEPPGVPTPAPGNAPAAPATSAETTSDRIFKAIQACLPAAIDVTGVNTNPDGTQVGYAGSGTIIHEDGYILTNAHVVGSGQISAQLGDGRGFPCRFLARHPSEDLAIVKIDAGAPLPFVRLGRNDGLKLGAPAIVIGNPNGLSHTVSTGIVSRLAQGYIQNGHIQTTAAVNGGNSGGPLLDEHGELIGVVSMKIGGEAMGLAIPVDRVRRMFSEILLDEQERGWSLGIAVDTFGPEARVVVVDKGGPAETAGVQVGDVIAWSCSKPVRDGIEFYLRASDRNPQEPLVLELRRAGAMVNASVTPKEVPLRPAIREGEFLHGLRFEVFKGMWNALPDFDKLTPAERGYTTAFTHALPGAGNDQFALRMMGFVEVPADGAWSFFTNSDDGSRLWIDDALVVDNDGSHAPTERRGSVRLQKGKHAIRVAHVQGVGGVILQVSWSGPGIAKQEIPAGALFVRP